MITLKNDFDFFLRVYFVLSEFNLRMRKAPSAKPPTEEALQVMLALLDYRPSDDRKELQERYDKWRKEHLSAYMKLNRMWMDKLMQD